MRSLRTVYESARRNIPAKNFPERDRVPAWEDLAAAVRAELEALKHNIVSVVSEDARLLASHHRVISVFNRGLRAGYFADTDQPSDGAAGDLAHQAPYRWGWQLARQSRDPQGELNPGVFSQFITATHLLAYEFGQLDRAYAGSYEFLLRAIGPERAAEFGELVFALPVLMNFRARRIREVVTATAFDFERYYADRPPNPTHVDYLEEGIIALFDPAEERWVKVVADFGLAGQAFEDGSTLQSEDFQAPEQAAAIVAAKPLAARDIVQRQVRRIALARCWIGELPSVGASEQSAVSATLCDVFALTPEARIRGAQQSFGDILAFEVVHGLSDFLEGLLGPEDTRFALFRQHFPAFAHGFDPRYEAAVNARVLASVRRGAAVGDSLRRFRDGDHYCESVVGVLSTLGSMLRRLNLAVADPVEYVNGCLAANRETPVAAALLKTFRQHQRLARELFQEHSEHEFFSTTLIQTDSHFDLVRGALFHVVQAGVCRAETPERVPKHLGEARSCLQRLVERDSASRQPATAGRRAAAGYNLTISRTVGRDSDPGSTDEWLTECAGILLANFDALTHVLFGVVQPLRIAFALDKPQSLFRDGYHEALQRESFSRASV